MMQRANRPLLSPSCVTAAIHAVSTIKGQLHIITMQSTYRNSWPIFTIFMNIFIMINWIQGFIWGLVSTMLEQHILYTLISSWLLYSEIFTVEVEPCPKVTLVFGVTLDSQIYGFQRNTASRIQNYIVFDLFGTRYTFLTQTAHLLLNLWMWDLIVLFPPNPESLTTSK